MQSFQSRARTLLTHVYPVEYRDLYLKAKASATGKKGARQYAQNWAKTQLRIKYEPKYREIYEGLVGQENLTRTHRHLLKKKEVSN